MERRTLAQICIIFLIPSLPLYSQNEAENIILTYVYNIDNGTVTAYNELIKSALEIEIEREGFSYRDMPKPPSIASSFESLNQAEEYLRSTIPELEDTEGFNYAAVCLFSVSEEKKISLIYLMFNLATGQLISRTEEQADIDLQLDSVLYRGAEELLGRADIEPVQKKETPGEEDTGLTEADDDTVEADREKQPDEPAEKTADTDSPDGTERSVPTTKDSSAESSPAIDAGPVNTNRFTVLAGFSPFLPAGRGTKYLSLGLQPRLNIGFRFNNPGNSLYIGLNIGFLMFQAEGTILTAQTYVAALGPDLRYFIDFGGALHFFFLISGGPAMYILQADPIGFIYKLVPYGKAGMGLDIHFGKVFGITFTVEYQVIYEGSLFLMGFTPGADIVLRL